MNQCNIQNMVQVSIRSEKAILKSDIEKLSTFKNYFGLEKSENSIFKKWDEMAENE